MQLFLSCVFGFYSSAILAATLHQDYLTLDRSTSCSFVLAPISSQDQNLDEILKDPQVKLQVSPVPVMVGRSALELLLIRGVYPPYFYSFSLLDQVLAHERAPRRILVVGGGNGYDAIALAYAYPESRIDVVDIDQRAIINADLNVDFHDLNGRVRVFGSDLFDQVTEQYDLMLFTAPRSVQAIGYNDRHEDTRYFDQGGEILQRFERSFSGYLTEDGKLYLMTEATWHPSIAVEAKLLFSDQWSLTSGREGHFGIFRVSVSH